MIRCNSKQHVKGQPFFKAPILEPAMWTPCTVEAFSNHQENYGLTKRVAHLANYGRERSGFTPGELRPGEAASAALAEMDQMDRKPRDSAPLRLSGALVGR
jgi:hypothetical protein